MDVLDTIRIHNENYPVTNNTDYYMGVILHSDYGFELNYRTVRRGVRENRWQNNLHTAGFSYNGTFGSINGLHNWETRHNELDITLLVDRPFHLTFWAQANGWAGAMYQVLFDGSEFLVEYVRSGPILELTI